MDVRDAILSQNTLDHEELILAFEEFIQDNAPDDLRRQIRDPGPGLIPTEEREEEFYNSEEYVEFLIELLNEFAPEGYYFGAHPDDESLFGFWPTEETVGRFMNNVTE